VAKLSLTPQGRSGLLFLALLPEAEFGRLMDEVRRPSEDSGGAAYIARIRDALAIDISQARSAYATLLALQHFGDRPSLISVRDIVDTLRDEPQILKAGLDSAFLKGRFNDTQASPTFQAFAKASELLLQNERNFSSARGLTDLRPLFPDDIETGPVLFVIQHELQIKYKRKDMTVAEEFFVAMDERDIEKLLDVLNRMRRKSEVLAKRLKEAKMPYLKTNVY